MGKNNITRDMRNNELQWELDDCYKEGGCVTYIDDNNIFSKIFEKQPFVVFHDDFVEIIYPRLQGEGDLSFTISLNEFKTINIQIPFNKKTYLLDILNVFSATEKIMLTHLKCEGINSVIYYNRGSLLLCPKTGIQYTYINSGGTIILSCRFYVLKNSELIQI